MKSLNLLAISLTGAILACSPSSDPAIDKFLSEWNVEAHADSFHLTSRGDSYPDASLLGGAISPTFSDGSFITTPGGRDYPGYIIFRVLSSDDESYFVRIYDTSKDYLPDRIEYSNGDTFIGRIVTTNEGFNIEFRRDTGNE